MRKEKYTPKERKALKERIARLAEKGDVSVYFKHEDTPEGALQAEPLLNRGQKQLRVNDG